MTALFIDELPEVAGILKDNTDITNVLRGALETVSGHNGSANPLNVAMKGLDEIGSKLDIDLSGLSKQLPEAVDAVKDLLPPDLLEKLDTIKSGFEETRKFIEESDLRKAIGTGGNLESVAFAVINDVLKLYQTRLKDLTSQLIDQKVVDEIKAALKTIKEFEQGIAAKQGNFKQFIDDFLIGNPLDIVKDPKAYLDKLYADFNSLQDDNLKSAFGQAQQLFGDELKKLEEGLTALKDAATSATTSAINAAYDKLDTLIRNANTALSKLKDAVTSLYTGVQKVVASDIGDTLFAKYGAVLDKIPLVSPPNLTEIVSTLHTALDGVVNKFDSSLTAEELQKRLDVITNGLHDTLVKSAMWQTRQMMIDFLAKIQHSIECIPLEMVRDQIQEVMKEAHQKLVDLGVTSIGTTIATGFTTAKDTITSVINDDLIKTVSDELDKIFKAFDVKQLLDGACSSVSDGVAKINEIIDEVQKALDKQIDKAKQLLENLDGLTYEPVSKKIIKEIDSVKQKLQAIKPESLSAPQKLALKAALAVIDSVNLEQIVEDEIKKGYHAAEAELKKLIDRLTEVLKEFVGKIDQFNPETLLKPVMDLFDEANKKLNSLNAHELAQPLYDLTATLTQKMNELAPSTLLKPLQEPYNAMMGVVGKLDPNSWVQPLIDLYAKLQELVKYTDLSPLMADLDKRRADLFSDAANALTDSLNSAIKQLPDVLQPSFGAVVPALTDTTKLILGSDTDLTNSTTDITTKYKLSGLFAPLDAIFDQFVKLVEAAPPDTLTTIFNDVRIGLTTGLSALNPAQVVTALTTIKTELEGHTPTSLISLPSEITDLPAKLDEALKNSVPGFEQRAEKLRADVAQLMLWIKPDDPQSPLQDLNRAHKDLTDGLGKRITALDGSTANASYVRVRDHVLASLPAFMHQDTPLQLVDITNGLKAMRPSLQAADLDARMDAFLTKIKPLHDTLDKATASLFDGLRQTINMLNPLTLQDEAKKIYLAIADKVKVLDPQPIAKQLHDDIYAPLRIPLEAIAPAAIGKQLDDVYQTAVSALSAGIKKLMDKVVDQFDKLLKTAREAIQNILQQVKTVLTDTMAKVRASLDRIEKLVFVDVLERIDKLIDRLGASFDTELDRIVQAFDQMIHAIPLGGSSAARPIAA